jgi:lipoprotein-anchoring transpeptidase ErfK/SrfK
MAQATIDQAYQIAVRHHEAGQLPSMGCIRLRSDDIALVYDLMVESKSMVVVKD